MSKFKAVIHVYRKRDVLNPEEPVIHSALHHLGFDSVSGIQAGKFFAISLDAEDQSDAAILVGKMSKQLLANSVAETFEIIKVQSV
ncbi:MAG TPA: phosphoribosylformylglycinamidine synthase subunit PurS [Candidatus Paceibacterota bacterium]